MEIRRFFVDPSDIQGELVTVRGDEFLHLTKVLRYKVGYRAVILANDGIERMCTVREIARDFAVLCIDDEKKVDEKHVRLTLYAGNLKNNKLDIVIQKAVELGVDRVVPFTSANCAERKFSLERARRIALEAAKQCGSVYLSEVDDITDLDGAISDIKDYDCVLFAYEFERKNPIYRAAKGKNVAIIVGPEGGFTPDEAQNVIAAGAVPVTLGRRILRAETASIVAGALVLNSLGELDHD